jgi:hypothetical protein
MALSLIRKAMATGGILLVFLALTNPVRAAGKRWQEISEVLGLGRHGMKLCHVAQQAGLSAEEGLKS